jgi:gas vesicle protein
MVDERSEVTTMADQGHDSAAYLGWFFLGTLVGAAAALLLAPKTGRETRDLLTGRGEDFWQRASEVAGDAQTRASDVLEKGRGFVEEQAQRLRSAFDAGRSAMREEMNRGGTEMYGDRP